MSLVAPDSTRMNDKVRKPFLDKYWPHCYGLGIALIIYMRSRAEVNAWSATLGGIGFALLMGSAGLRDFNRERKASQADPVPKPVAIVEAPTPTIVNETPCQTRSSKRWIERLRKAPLSFILIFLYAIAAVFEMLRVPTTAGDRWIWQLEFETFDALESVGDHYVEVKLISRSLITREVITFAILIGLLLTYFVYSRYRKSIRKYLQQNLHVLGLLLYGVAITLPLLFVPCTYVAHLGIFREVSVTRNEYRWLWQVGVADIKSGVLLLEELIVSIAAIFIYLTLRLRHSHEVESSGG